MWRMRLEVMPAAAKSLRNIPEKTATTIIDRMKAIADDPFARHANVTRLSNDDRFRLRVGDWRALYRVDRKGDRVVLVDLKRGEAYR